MTDNPFVVFMPKFSFRGPLDPYCYACMTRRPKHGPEECRKKLLGDLHDAIGKVASIQRRLAKLESTRC